MRKILHSALDLIVTRVSAKVGLHTLENTCPHSSSPGPASRAVCMSRYVVYIKVMAFTAAVVLTSVLLQYCYTAKVKS